VSDVKLSVVGGGGFGLALAHAALRRGHGVTLWSRRPIDERAEGLETTTELARAAANDLVLVAVPSSHVEEAARALGQHLEGRHLVVHVSRGLVGDGLHTVSHVLRHETAARRVGCLAGPLGATTLREGLPGGGVIGTAFGEVAEAVRAAIAGPSLRLYETEDVLGVELSSALVGLLALALGFAKELGYGPSTLSVLMTRGLNEVSRFGVALGAEEKTFHGMAGFGDLLAAAFGDERPEVLLGKSLARGVSLDAAAKEAGAHVEGVKIARRVSARAKSLGLEMPISDAIASVVDGSISPRKALDTLMLRRARKE
jgi:glycerol-3-phosphate dehydrogenase (NAD(P)+)